MTPRQISALLLLSALWGGSFLFIRIAAPVLGSVWLSVLRVAIAGVALLGYGLATRQLPPLRERWRAYLVVGALNSAVPFLLIGSASVHLPASLTATLNATTPLFGLLIGALWLGEPLSLRTLGGLLVGFLGVVVLIGLGPVPLTATTIQAGLFSLLGALSYGFAAVYIKAKVQGAEPQALTTYSMLFAALLLLPVAPLAAPLPALSPLVAGSVIALGLLCTAVAYQIYFYLVVTAGPTRATMVTYLSPAFGTLWGALLLREPLGLGNYLGLALILASVALTGRRGPATGQTKAA